MTGTRAIYGILLVSALVAAPRAEAGKKGTYFEIDAHFGFTTPTHESMGPALSYGGMIGIGGKLKRLRPRFYFMLGVLHQAYSHEGTYAATGAVFTARQSLLDLSAGLRIVWPLYKGLRIYADLMGTASCHRSDVERTGADAKSTRSWAPAAVAALGLQYRWHRNASTGIRFEGTFYGSLNSAAMSTVGLDQEHNAKLVIAVVQSWYF